MDLSGLRETISIREKILPERSKIVGSVNGKSIIVPRIGPLGREQIWPHAITKPVQRAKARWSGPGQFEFPLRDNFSCKRGKFPGGCNRPLRPRSRACGSSADWTAGKDNCFFSALRDSQFRFRTEGVRGEEALYR